METAIHYGTIREEVFIDDHPENNIFIVEIVTHKRKTKHWLLFTEKEIQTNEIILKNCLYCGKVLS